MNEASHPGQVISDAMNARGMSQRTLARLTHSTPKHINKIVNGKVRLTAGMAVRFELALIELRADALLRMQVDHDVWKARQTNP